MQSLLRMDHPHQVRHVPGKNLQFYAPLRHQEIITNQQQKPRRFKCIHPSLGIINLAIVPTVLSFRLLRYGFRLLAKLNGKVYRMATRVELWATK